jgi:hypothetical protein
VDLVLLPVEARIRREVYGAVVRGVLKDWATHADFAARIGQKREYLEALLQDDGSRTPGPATAERIARALPLSEDQRNDVLEQMLLAGERRLRKWREAHAFWREAPPADGLDALRTAHWAATYAADASTAREQYRLLRDSAADFLRYGRIRRQPLVAVETCLLLHDVQSVLNRPAVALYHAKLAGATMENLDPSDFPGAQERFDHLRVNAYYAEAVTLTTLRLPRRAGERLDEMESAIGESDTAAAFWAPHIVRGRLAAEALLPRFGVRHLEDLAGQARDLCERRADRLDEQMALLADVSLARGYVRFGTDASRRKAMRLLRPAVEGLDRVPDLGPLRRVVVLETFAPVCWARREREEWAEYAGRALAVAEAAGLDHQARRLRQTYGDALDDVISHGDEAQRSAGGRDG